MNKIYQILGVPIGFLLLSGTAFGQYCSGGPSSTFDSNIEAVTITGDNGTQINYTGCPGVTGVEDESAQVVELTAGDTYTLDITIGSCSANTYGGVAEVWIDYNQNDIFDASESIGTATIPGFGLGPVSESLVFTVPLTATGGVTGIRAMHQESGTLPLNPCGTFAYGSVVDFTADVTPAPSTCPFPTGLTATATSQTEVDFTWTAGGTETEWNIEWGAPGFTPGTGAEIGSDVVTVTPTTSILGLNPDTNYEFYVQGVCGVGDESLWAGPVSVYTGYCLPTYSSTFDYMSLFETSLAVENINYTATAQPAGGYEDLTSSDTLKAIEESSFDFETNYVGGGNVIRIWADFNNNLQFDTSEELYFQFQSGNPNNAHFGNITLPATVTPGSYKMRVRSEYDFNFTSNPTPCSAELYGSTIDIVLEVLPVPSCPSISDLIVSNVNSNTADVDWTIEGSETEWIIEYDTTGFTQGTGNTVQVTSNSETLTVLMENTSYDVYVTAICAPGDSSFAFGPVLFTTECLTFEAIDFCESFDSGSQTENCWTVLNENGDGDAWDLDYSFNTNSGDQVAALNTDFNSGNNDDWLISPQITLTGNEVMSFFYRVQSAGEPNDFEVLLSTTGKNPADFEDTLMFLNSYNNIEYLDSTINLSAFTGDVYVAFHVPSGGLDGWILYIDDVCFDVCIPTPGQDGSQDICRADGTVDLNQLIVKGQENGEWVYPGNQQLIVDDSLFNVSNLPTGEYDILYIVEGSCTNDTTTASIDLFPPSSAGENGTLNVCRNEPVDLFSGLSGNVDMGGTWYDPSDNALPNSQPFSSNIQGSYNYDYVVSNGVCPADTQFVEVLVDECDWMSVEEEEMTKIEVYPNPASEILNINNGSNMEHMTIEMFDMNGRVVYSDDQSLSNTDNTTISIDHLEKGIYTLRVGNQEGQKTFKIVKH